eukprot:NODE_1736_length_1624_cov_41.355097_g1655_i0.p1 GENE.NODE_1736_length_1624_cov_41.355097_g1655_i0~~NODE_1736_length_1624_cov_41.355097_g1655_i0.p1  ORF type:complete len:459 (-),score=117.91 NODE_1736_length_1624_cov_41.355097_g1655_i0:171-1547(-)
MDPVGEVVWDDEPQAEEPAAPATVKKEKSKSQMSETASVASSAVGGNQDELLYQPTVLDAIFHHIPIGVVLQDAWGMIYGFSKGSERMFMYSSWEVVGENISNYMPPSEASRHDYYLSRARQRITQRLATMMHRSEALIALDDLAISEDEQATRISNDVLRMSMFGGQKHEVLALDKTATAFPLEIAVSPVILKNALYYLGYLVDVRDLTLFQDLTVKQELTLRSILDTRTLSRLLSGEKTIHDAFECATIAYIEIVDYAEKAVALESDQQMADFVKDIFGVVDTTLMSSTGVEKIKTFGCQYIMAAGLPLESDNHAESLFMTACNVLSAIQSYNSMLAGTGKKKKKGRKEKTVVDGHEWKVNLCPIDLRIGMHTGPCVAGLYSTLKGEYDVYGSTALKAYTLQTLCRPGTIHISAETFGMLPPEYGQLCEIRRDGGIPYTYEANVPDDWGIQTVGQQ